MRLLNYKLINRELMSGLEAINSRKAIALMLLTAIMITACQPQENQSPWKISVGRGSPKEQILVDGSSPQEVKICLDEKGGSGYPVTVIAKYDDESYAGLLEHQCMYFTGKKVSVRFGTPSSGKYAQGTFTIVTSYSQ